MVFSLAFILFNTVLLFEVEDIIVSDHELSPGVFPTSVLFLIRIYLNIGNYFVAVYSFLLLFGVTILTLDPIRLDNV